MDYAIKYPETVPLRRVDARPVEEALTDIFLRLGIPGKILTVRALNSLTEVFRMLGIHHLKTSPCHPQTDGMVEKFNGTSKNMIKKATEDPKDKLLPYFLFCIQGATTCHCRVFSFRTRLWTRCERALGCDEGTIDSQD